MYSEAEAREILTAAIKSNFPDASVLSLVRSHVPYGADEPCHAEERVRIEHAWERIAAPDSPDGRGQEPAPQLHRRRGDEETGAQPLFRQLRSGSSVRTASGTGISYIDRKIRESRQAALAVCWSFYAIRRNSHMSDTLKQFYHGNLSPVDRRMVKGSEIARAVDKLSKVKEFLEQALPLELRSALVC